MPWSTSQLADLAGTSVSTIRFYHRRGLLDEPTRRANGYKEYDVPHLVRLLRIRRLVDLGLPLEEVAAADDEPAATTLRLLDTELEQTIARLQRVRRELAHVIEHSAPTGLPPGFSEVAENMSATDQAMLLIYSRVLGPDEMASLREMMAAPRTPAQIAFAELPDDADVVTRDRLVGELRGEVRRLHEQHPWTLAPGSGGPRSPQEIQSLFRDAFASLYNSAQRDVLARIYDGGSDAR